MSATMTRRRFLGTATPAAVGAGLAASQTWKMARAAERGANERIRVGLVGCGGRGQYLMEQFQRAGNVKITAVCDVNEQRAAEAQKKAGGEKVMATGDFRLVVESKDVDVVIVAPVGHWHVLPTIHACRSGKDVYVEKPLGTSIGEGRAAVAAARKYKRVVQVGCQQHSWEHYIEAVELIRSGKLGTIAHVHVWDFEQTYPGWGSPPDASPPPFLDWEFYLGPAPQVPYNPNRYDHHYWFHDYGSGYQVDWAVHHYDIVHWAMGVSAPVSAVGHGGKYAFPDENTEWPDTFDGACEYPPGPVAKHGFLLTCAQRRSNNHPLEGAAHGKMFYGTHGTLVLHRAGYQVFSQTHGGKKVLEEKSGRSKGEHDAVVDHIRNFLECCRTRKAPNCEVEIGHCSSNPGHLMNIAYRVGRRIRWNAQTERIVDDPEADAFVTKKYRSPWNLSI